MPHPRVSVVMTAWNREDFVDEAIRSVLGQTFTDFELIVVDDGSTDGTAAILARHAAADPRVRVITQTNQGIANAANAGCAVARGEFIARFDSDDVCFPDRLARQVEFLDRNPTVAVVGGTARLIGPDGPTALVYRCGFDGPPVRRLLDSQPCVLQPTVMMRRAAFEHCGPYRQAFAPAEDYDLWLRLADHYEFVNLDNPPLISYRVHAAQASSTKLRAQAIGALAAVTAMRIRRATGKDPLDGATELSATTLAPLGITERDVEAAIVELELYRTSLAIPTATAAELVEAEATLARIASTHPWNWYGATVDSLRRRIEVEIAVRRIKLLLAERRPVRATGSAIAAVCRHPGLATRLVARLVHGGRPASRSGGHPEA